MRGRANPVFSTLLTGEVADAHTRGINSVFGSVDDACTHAGSLTGKIPEGV